MYDDAILKFSIAYQNAMDKFIEVMERYDPCFDVNWHYGESDIAYWEENRMAYLISNYLKMNPKAICIQNVKFNKEMVVDLLIIDAKKILYIETPKRNCAIDTGRKNGDLGLFLQHAIREELIGTHSKNREEFYLFLGNITIEDKEAEIPKSLIELISYRDGFSYYNLNPNHNAKIKEMNSKKMSSNVLDFDCPF